MRDYLLVIGGFVVVLDIAFLVWGRRRNAGRSTGGQIPIPFEEKRSGSERRHQPAGAS
jgi:hypothetical protein